MNLNLNFISSLFESQLFPNRNTTDQYSTEEIQNMTFLYLLALQLMLHESNTRKFASEYIYKSFKNGHFSSIELSSTDLYWLLFQLKNQLNDLINLAAVTTWVKDSLKEKTYASNDRRFFLDLQKLLNIKEPNYKSMRILISDWANLTLNQKKLASTRLILAFRTHLKKSDILPHLESLIAEHSFEIKDVINPELDSRIFEDMSGTSSCAIASVNQPLGEPIKRIKRGNRTKRAS